MKKLLLITAIGLFFSSCKKEISESQLQEPEQHTAMAKNSDKTNRNVFLSSYYDAVVWSCSAGENIHLTGEVVQHIIMQISDTKFHGLFEANFNQVTGVGETTGKIYSGGGMLKGQVNSSLDPDKPHTSSSTKEKLHFLNDGVGFEFYVTSKYVMNAQGEVKIDYLTENSEDCSTQ